MAGLIVLAPSAAFAEPSVTVSGPWFRFLLPGIPAGGYMRLQNPTGHPVLLTGASSPACGMMALHKTVTMNGIDKMAPVPSITIPTHGAFTFRPGDYHIMCMQPRMKPGETVPVTLEFSHAPSVTVRFMVYGANGKPAGQ
ncbi:MAG: copper chaperone PCu(A)C [Acetobacteraceae bacterium]